jgi:hypothetical protein
MALSGVHVCRLDENITRGDRVDVTHTMRKAAIQKAITKLALSPKKIWEDINSKMDHKYSNEAIVKERRNKIINLVKTTRSTEFGNDKMTKIKLPKYAQVSSEDPRPFLITNYKYLLPLSDERNGRKLHNLLMWAHPDLMTILRRHSTSIYIDCTFRCVPKPYSQCLIIMVYDDETDIYVPVVYFLLDNKCQWTYWHALHFVLVETETKFYLSTITSDFEISLLNAIKEQLPNTHRIGCLFHFKQALRRRMRKLHIPDTEIKRAMQKGSIDLLTIVKKEEVNDKIEHFRKRFAKGETKQKWNEFFAYFKDTWMIKYHFNLWNVSKLEGGNVRICNRTNNALESFNRSLGEQFSSPHPNILHFIAVIKKISIEYVKEIHNVKLGVSIKKRTKNE